MAEKTRTNKIRVAVIPAGGKGNRIAELPLTRILPKSMLPVLNKPILEHIIEKLVPLGVKEVYFVLGHKNRVITDYFGDGGDWGLRIKYLIETAKQRKGIAAAVYKAKCYVKEPFLVVLGDDFTVTRSLQNLVEDFFRNKAWAVTGVVEDNDVESLRRTNYVSLESSGRIVKMVEKPELPETKVRGCGIYIFRPIVFDYIKRAPLSKRGFKEITETLDAMSKKGKVYGSYIKGANININTLEDLVRAMKLSLKKYGDR